MPLEASEVAVRVKLLGGAAFKAEADGTAASLDRIGAAGHKAGGSVAAGTGKSHSMLTKMGAKASKVGSQMIGLGRTMTMAGVPIAALGYYAAKSSSQFSQAMTLLSTQANMPFKSISKVSAAVEAMAPKVAATPLALAQALYPIESIGLRGQKALNALKAAAMGSAVGLDSLENTADAVTTAMSSKIKGVGGPVHAMAVMDRAIGLGKMHLQDLTESFKSGIVPIAQQFGLSFTQILAAAAGLTRVGIPANQVMARMRLTLVSMISPTSAGHKAMKKLGITQYQLADDLRKPGGLLAALHDIKDHMDAFGHPDYANSLLAQMFGKSRGMASIGSLLNQLGQIDPIYAKTLGTKDQLLYTHMGQTEQTPAFKYKAIQANYYAAMIKLGDALNRVLLPLLVQLVPYLTSAVKWFGQLPKGVQKFIVILLAATVVGGPILMFTGALVKVGGILLGAFSRAIGMVAGEAGLAGLGGAAGGTKLALLRVVGPLGLFVGGLLWANKNIPFVHQGLLDLGNAIRGFLGMTKSTDRPHNLINGPHHMVSPGLHPTRQHPETRDLPGGTTGYLGMKGWHKLRNGVLVPGMASGGLVTHAGLAMVGEEGPELLSLPRGAVVRPSTPGTIPENTFPRNMNGDSGPDTIVTQVILDAKVVGESVNQYNRKKQNRR